jgi:chromosome segregation ATPase
MAAATFESTLAAAFQEAETTLRDLHAKRAEIDQQIEAAEERFTRLRNAQAALEGKLSLPAAKERKTHASSGARAKRGSRDKVKDQISNFLKQHPEGWYRTKSPQLSRTKPYQISYP